MERDLSCIVELRVFECCGLVLKGQVRTASKRNPLVEETWLSIIEMEIRHE